ncbi:MAG: hypothetical protein Q9222_007946, partial [Ikaeria aurantiellina]
LFPSIYPSLPRRTQLNWDVHVVSLVQSVFVCAAAIWVILVDEERKAMDWKERVWGYDGGGGMIQAFAAGYFLWDLQICVRYLGIFGWGMLMHAVSALIVFSLADFEMNNSAPSSTSTPRHSSSTSSPPLS